MQNWSKQRRGQKQNQQMQSFQIKTRQYTNISTLGPNTNNIEESLYSPKQTPKTQNSTQNSFNVPNFMNKAQKASFKQRYNLEDDQPNVSPFGAYNQKTTLQRTDIGKISRNNNLQVDYRKYMKDNNSKKSPIKKEYLEKPYTQNVNMMDVSQTQNFKRDNAKKKGLQMKMTNIECINEQISSLLSMVNKNKRINDTSNSKSITRNNSKEGYDYREKDNSLQKCRPKLQISPSPSKNAQMQTSKRYLNKQYRERVYSDLNHQFREQFDSIKYENKKYTVCNEEQNSWSDMAKNKTCKYSPKQLHDNQKYLQSKKFERSISPYQRQHTKSAYNKKQAYPQRQYQKMISPYRQYNKRGQETASYDRSPKKMVQNTQPSGYKYYQKQKQQQVYEQKLPEYVPKYKKMRQKLQKQQNEMLPVSMQATKYNEMSSKNQRPTFAFEEHLQTIRGKIVESEQKNLKYQQRLRQQETGITIDQKATGRLYKKNPAEFQNSFQLKVYPVEVDKPNTLKIAEKLADQIQIDKKLLLPRILLQKEEDQYKWSQIELGLKTKQLKMTKFQIQQLLELSPEQRDSSAHQRGQGRKNIADLLFQAQKHWQRQVFACASQKGLKMQNFNADSIDSNRNGFVSVEDLAHFVSTYTGRQYRSKDTTLIYRRLQLLQGSKNNENVQFSTFVRAVAI